MQCSQDIRTTRRDTLRFGVNVSFPLRRTQMQTARISHPAFIVTDQDHHLGHVGQAFELLRGKTYS